MQQPAMPPPFSPAAGTVSAAGQHATPISSRPPPEPQQQVDELGGGSASAGSSFVVDHDGASAGGGGDDGERNGPSGGNRWPRQETLALLKIRSEMDAAFREAALKGPLWEQVARCVVVVMRVQLPRSASLPSRDNSPWPHATLLLLLLLHEISLSDSFLPAQIPSVSM